MARTSVLIVGLALMVGMVAAQAPKAAVASGSKINAELKSKLDTRHAQVGDKVTAVTTSDIKEHGVKVLPKGSTLDGHVTEESRAAGPSSPARNGVLFDQAVTSHGQTVPLRAGIASVLSGSAAAANPEPMAPMGPAPMMMPAPASAGASGGGLLGGAVGGLGATAGGMVGAGTAPLGGAGMLNTGASAAPLAIAMPAANAQSQSSLGSVLSAPQGDVELNSGTRVQLQVLGASSAAGASASGQARAH
jgi:hypothetical protein